MKALKLGIAALAVSFCAVGVGHAQRRTDRPVIVQPGAPGKATKVLPSNTNAKLPPNSAKNIEFMQGMIMHHSQAVEMTDMIASRSKNPEVIRMGVRISQSQAQEIEFMKRWLTARGGALRMKMGDMGDMKMGGMDMNGMGDMKMDKMSQHHMMPGMLSPEQMELLKNAKGEEFDKLFLAGMIQHHKGALVMVKGLFGAPGAGQDAEIFNFASDVDSGQRAEIDAMQRILDRMPQTNSKTEEHYDHE